MPANLSQMDPQEGVDPPTDVPTTPISSSSTCCRLCCFCWPFLPSWLKYAFRCLGLSSPHSYDPPSVMVAPPMLIPSADLPPCAPASGPTPHGCTTDPTSERNLLLGIGKNPSHAPKEIEGVMGRIGAAKGEGKRNRKVGRKAVMTASVISDEDEDVCPTCLEAYGEENPKIFAGCGHSFHLACIYEWLERSKTCPVCGQKMQFNESSWLFMPSTRWLEREVMTLWEHSRRREWFWHCWSRLGIELLFFNDFCHKDDFWQ